jgi:GNAT superfamily N-acetyltransferase
MPELRAARPEDVSAIVAIDPVGIGRADEIAALVREHACIVAVTGGEAVGFLAVKRRHFFERDFVDLLFVAPGWRRKGVGRALMRAALGSATTRKVFVSTNESNTAMRELLRGEGWTPAGVLTGLDEGDPEHVFFQDTN